jgi:hypothetical protein
MTGRSPVRILGVIITAALLATVTAGASDIPPALAIPGNRIPGQQIVHTSDPGAEPIRSVPAPAGINPVPPNITRALQERARIHLPQSTPVPPTQELELLDPNVDPLGRPAAKVIPTTGPDGVARIDIPPCVLVHKYYYTGDRSFQAPLLPGGPTVVVVNHPADGERIYLEIQMPPGAPRVIYTRHSIEYNYGIQSVILSFGAHGRPKVTFRQGASALTRARVAGERARQATSRFIERTGVPEARRKVHEKVQTVGGATADRLHDIGKAAVTPVIQVVKLIPGIQLLTSSPEQTVEHERNSLVKGATTDLTSFEASIPTVR